MKNRRKILIVVNDLKRAFEHEWFVTYINRDKFDVEFLLINSRDSAMATFLSANHVVTYFMDYRGKGSIPILFFKMIFLFFKKKFDVIHTHLFISSLIALPAAWFAGINRRIMTRHHSDYHHVWFPSAVKYDRLANMFATKIVAISNNVSSILINREGVSPDKVILVHHGIDFTQYMPLDKYSDRVIAIKNKYQIKQEQQIVGVVSRFTEWKGVQYIIPAFKKLLIARPNAVLVMANAAGDYEARITEMLEELPENSYRKVKFEMDITALFSSFDVFIHVPISVSSEAFGQIYIEALALKIPSVFTASGVLAEFGKDKINCFIVPFCDSDAIYRRVTEVLDHSLNCSSIIDNAYKEVRDNFSFEIKINKLMELYQ